MSYIAPRLASKLATPRPAGAMAMRSVRKYATSAPPTIASRFRHAVNTTLILGGTAALVVYYYDSRSAIHEYAIMPLIRASLDAEESHRLAVRALAMGSWLRPKDVGVDGPELRAELFGLELDNPIGLAAGFDKDAEAIDGLFDLGFGYVEVGSVTPEAQPGNPKPRFFRLEADDACINRYGFNSLGHRQALHRLQSRIRSHAQSHPSSFPDPLALSPLPPTDLPRSLRKGKLLAVNLGKNKTSAADSNEDYLAGVRLLGPYADILVVNVSSPNTPGLRGLQGKDFLGRLLGEVVKERDALQVDQKLKPKVVVKVAPDLDESELEDIASAVRISGVDGVIVSNTTIKRDGLGLKSANAKEVGGLSGAPLKPLSILALTSLRTLLPPSIPIIGCGGIQSGQDALDFAQAGATVVQSYTSFGYRGVGFPRLVKDEASEILKSQNSTWRDYVKIGELKWHEGLERTESDLRNEADELKRILQQDRLRRESETRAKPPRSIWTDSQTETAVERVLQVGDPTRTKALQSGENRLTTSIAEREALPSSQPTPSSTIAANRTPPSLPNNAPQLITAMIPSANAPASVDVPIGAFAKGTGKSPMTSSAIASPPGEMIDVDEWRKAVKQGNKRLV